MDQKLWIFRRTGHWLSRARPQENAKKSDRDVGVGEDLASHFYQLPHIFVFCQFEERGWGEEKKENNEEKKRTRRKGGENVSKSLSNLFKKYISTKRGE